MRACRPHAKASFFHVFAAVTVASLLTIGCSDEPEKTTPGTTADTVSDTGTTDTGSSSGSDGASSSGGDAVSSDDGGGSSSGGGDVTSKVPQPPTLCHPCKANSECIAVSGKKSYCNNHGGLGFYCGAGCGSDDDCRSDFRCGTVDDVEGNSRKQCVPKGKSATDIGECFCSAEASDKSLETSCYNELKKDGKKVGQCSGKRSCGKSGLSKCDADVPTVEVCDGKDNDCSGKADDNVCDDGQPCTQDLCKTGGGCENKPTKGACDDGDPCTTSDNCSTGTCKGVPNSCDDANPCTKDSCVPGEGCKHTKISGCNQCKDNKACDDGDLCTTDICAVATGACSNKPKKCDDGDACTIDSCDKVSGNCTAAPGKCGGTQKIPFSAKFNCNSPANALWTLDKGQPGGPAWGFDGSPAPPGAKSAACSLNFNNGKDFQCPAGAKNVSGKATSPWFDATDAHPKAQIRVFFQLGGTWEKNNFDELRMEYTLDGKQWSTIYDAYPSNTPTQWQSRSISISAVKGKKFRIRFRFFTTNCLKNTGTGPFIDDLRIEDAACHANADCTTTSKCQIRGCINGGCYTVNKCNDGDACTSDSCNAQGVCSFNPIKSKEGKPCADNNACTSKKLCQAGKCVAQVIEPDGTSCDDGRQCTIKDECQSGTCKGTVACNDGNPCTADSCGTLFKYCFHEPITGACSDNSACTSDDKCALGVCTGKKKDCDDDNACTEDSCNAIDGGCVNKGQGQTGPNGTWQCDDGDSCTVDTCDKKTGACSHKADTSCGSTVTVPYKQPFECGSSSVKAWDLTGTTGGPGWAVDSDPNPPGSYSGSCSLNFNNGKNFTCPSGATKVSGDATSPWIDATKIAGNQLRMRFRLSGNWEYTNADEMHVLVSTNGTNWQKIYDTGNGNPNYWYLRQLSIPQYAGKKFKVRFRFFTTNCTNNTGTGPFIDDLEIYNAGCNTAADCSDGSNKCQTWTCTSSKTCSVKTKSCNDNKPCTYNNCNTLTGQCEFPHANDGNGCNDNDACTYPDRCQAGQCHGTSLNCNDKSACTKDSCDPKKGCVFTPVCSDGDPCTSDGCDEGTQKCTYKKVANGTACDDGDICTTYETCGSGKCIGQAASVGVLIAQTISNPTSIVVDKSTVYVVSRGQSRIYRVAGGKATVYAGSGGGYKDGALKDARFNGPHSAALHGGELYVADTYNYRIRNISGGQVTTIAGSSAGFADGKGTKARFNQPRGIASDGSGTFYVADTYNQRIRRVTTAGDVKTFTGSVGGFLDGPANVARFNAPHDVAIAKNGELYVADYNNHRIRKVATTGAVSTLAGGAVQGFVDGFKGGARFYRPTGVAFDKSGALWVADYYNSAIRKISPAGHVTTVTGKKGYGYTNGALGVARFARPWDLTFDAKGIALVADYNNSRVRTITPTGAGACNDNNPCTTDGCSPTTGECANKPTSKCDDKDPCTLDLCNPKDGSCSKAPNTCDDGDSCTVGTCNKASGGCTYKDVATCTTLQAVGYQQAFNCGAKSLNAWSLKSAGGPSWQVDSTPTKPGHVSPKCSLNFNNGKDYKCAAGAKAVSGTATSPWFDATKVSSVGGLMIRFRYSGRWETNNDDEFYFEWTTDEKKWNLASDMSWTSTSWGTRTIYLNNLAGKKFKVRFRFFTKDCNDNGWVGPFVDDFSIRDMNCTDPKDCSDGSLCTLDRCQGGRCSWSGVNCNDSDSCTQDTCKPATGCSNIPRPNGSGCSDSDSCTSNDICTLKSGKLTCVGTPTGKDGAACSDGKSCTKGDVCKTGKCVGVIACDDGNVCTKDSCHEKGYCHYEVDTKACDDNNACTTDVCKAVGANKCTHTAKCDDGNGCTVDSCDKGTGKCTHKPAAGCTNKLPWGTDFNCNGGGAGWSYKSVHSGGPQWAVDASPATPKPPTGGCSLNFNDGKGYTCPAGAKNVSATATSPWIDATDIVPSGAYIRLEYTISGRWRPSTGLATVYVEVSKNDKNWQVIRTLNYNLTYWSNQATTISSSYAGGKFKVRFRFQSVGCKEPTGDGIFIDRVRIRDIRCYKDSDCTGTSACTTYTCDHFQCKAKGVKCDDGLPCTNDVCDSKYGCRHYPHGDGVPCGSQVGCIRYRCKAAKCATETLKEGQACNDGDTCTAGDTCQGGSCKGNSSKPDGDPCSDSNACTTIDTCAGGTCGGTIGKVEEVAKKLSSPSGLALTSKDVLYVASSGNHRISRLDGNAWVTVAGSSYGFADGTGTKARFRYPTGLDVKDDGTVYVADRDNQRIRVISPTGVVTTLAGSGQQAATDGKGTAAAFRRPADVAIDGSSVVVADSYNNRIRRVAADGTVTTFAGGSAGFADGKGTAARFSRPTGVAAHKGVVFVADSYNHRIRRIAADGVVTTFAGTSYGWTDAVGKSARFRYPEGISAATDGTLYVGDRNNNAVRRIDAKARVVTLTGRRGYGFDTGALSHARWANPTDAVVDSKGLVWVADRNNGWVRKISTKVGVVNVCDDSTLCTKDTCDSKTGACDNGLANCDDGNPCTVSTCGKDGKCASAAYGCDDGNPCTADSCTAKAGCAHTPAAGCKTCKSDVDCGDGKACTKDTCDAKKGCVNTAIAGCSGCKTAADCEDGDACTTHTCSGGKCATAKAPDGAPCTDGNVCTAADHCAGGKCMTNTMLVSTLAGEGSAGLTDGTPDKAKFNRPSAVAVDKYGNVFVSDTGNHRVRRVTPWGQVGYAFGTSKGFFDGPAGNARVNEPAGLTIGADGAIYLADKGNNRIRRFRWGYNEPVSTLAGNGKAGAKDGPAKQAEFKGPHDVAEAAAGVFYVADHGNNRIRRIQNGLVVTVAGSTPGKVDGPLTGARFSAPRGLAWDGKALWIADTGNSVIRKLDPAAKSVVTVAGKTVGHKDAIGTAAAFKAPASLVFAAGALWIVDSGNHAIRRMSAAGGVSTLIGTASGFANGGAHVAKLNAPAGIAVGPQGHVYIADSANNRIRKVAAVADVCGDGQACVGDYCDAVTGKCTFGTAQSSACDDGNKCTADSCHASLKTCTNKAISGCK